MKIAVIMTIMLCCIALQALSLYEVIVYPQKIRTQDVSKYENKFKLLRDKLPLHGVVGYVSDCTEIIEDPFAKMFSAQYALAPLIIAKTVDTPLVIGYVCRTAAEKPKLDTAGLVTRMDLGNGVMLFQRETQ